MSAKLVIILVGLVLIIIAVLSSLTTKGPGIKLISPKLGVPLGIIGLLMIIFEGYDSNTAYVVSQMEKVSIGKKLKIDGPVDAVKVVSPIDKDSVDCRILTMGVYPKSHDKDIWVVLRPTDDKYYPQSDHTNTSYKRDGEWQVVTRFGGDLGEAYDLLVYETDEAASQFFSATIEKWKLAESYPGLTLKELPSGAKEVDKIVVYLRKNCRGVF